MGDIFMGRVGLDVHFIGADQVEIGIARGLAEGQSQRRADQRPRLAGAGDDQRQMTFADALGALEAEGFELIGAFRHKGERGGEMLFLPLGPHGQVQGVAQVLVLP